MRDLPADFLYRKSAVGRDFLYRKSGTAAGVIG